MGIRGFLGIITLTAFFAACNQPQTGNGEEKAAEDKPLEAIGGVFPQEFYDSMHVTMTAYYQLSAALVKADTLAADIAGAALQYHLDSLPVARMGLDSSRISLLTGQVGGISAELQGMLLEKAGLEGRRLSFQMVSDQLYDFLLIAGLKNTTVFRQYCPMAFNDRGAYWLSDKAEVLNPYFGDEMLHCGSVTDTLKF